MRIYVFDKEWSLVDSVGYGIGKGPGEISYIVDFEVSDRYIWVVDGRSLAIHQFNIEGDYITTKPYKEHPSRIVKTENSLILMSSSPGELFSSLSKNTLNINQSFGTIIKDQDKHFMSLTGHLEPREGNKGFIYIPRYQS